MSSIPMSTQEVIDRYFLEHRAKVLDIAAFLDRIDRCETGEPDFRIEALLACIKELETEDANRTERILNMLSDHSLEPIEKADSKGASGANPPSSS